MNFSRLFTNVSYQMKVNKHYLSFLRPAFTFANTRNKASLETHLKYLGSRKFYSIFNTRCIISVLFPAQRRLFHNSILFFAHNTHVLS
jgi:hypothetical protein